MEIQERHTKECRRIDDRRNHFDLNYKGEKRRIMPNRRTQKDRRKSD